MERALLRQTPHFILAFAVLGAVSSLRPDYVYAGSLDEFSLNTAMQGNAANYASGTPGNISDVLITTSSGPALTISNGSVTMESLSVINGHTYSISNATSISTSRTLTLGNSSGFTNCNSGVSNDLIYVSGGSNLTISGTNTGIGTGVLGVTLASSGNFNVASGSSLTVSSVITGAYGITKTGGGTLTLSAMNLYTGATNVSSGTLVLGEDAVSTSVVGTSVTGINYANDTFGSVTGVSIGDRVVFGGSIPGGLSASTVYYVIAGTSGSNFKVSLTKNGSSVNLTSNGSSVTASRVGTLGSASSAVDLGDSNTGANTVSLLTGGGYTIERAITVANYGNGTTIGGNTNGTSTFSGTISLNKSVVLTSAATGSNYVDFTGDITGNENVTIGGTGAAGAGIVRFSAVDKSYTGSTTINAGATLLANTRLATNGVSVNGILKGTGTINGLVTVNSGGVLAPGLSPGSQSFAGGLTFCSGAIYQWEHSGGNVTGTYDSATLTGGNLLIDATAGTGAKLQLSFADGTNFSNSFWNDPQAWTIIANGNGTSAGRFDNSNISIYVGGSATGSANAVAGEGAFSTALNGNNVVLNWLPNSDSVLSLGTSSMTLKSFTTGTTGSTSNLHNAQTTGAATTYAIGVSNDGLSVTDPDSAGSIAAGGDKMLTVALVNNVNGSAISGNRTYTVTVTNNGNSGDTVKTINVTANVFQQASLTTSTSGGNLNLTNTASNDNGASSQSAGVTINSLSIGDTTHFNAPTLGVSHAVGNGDTSGVIATVGTYSLKSNVLNNNFRTYNTMITSTAQYTDSALNSQASVSGPIWSISATQSNVSTGIDCSGHDTFSVAGQSADVANNSSYAGYYSTVDHADAAGALKEVVGTTATILAGTNNSGSTQTLEMTWRTRQDGEIYPGTTPPFSGSPVGLYSDVVNVSGVTGIYVLQMTYDPAVMPSNVQQGGLLLGWLHNGIWENAVLGNDYSAGGAVTNEGTTNWLTAIGGSLDSSDLGKFGVDTVDHTVWAVLNHNSEFAVIPEPASLGLLGLGALGLLSRRRRAA